jgi:tetratricopeptide (TPR) repeat protein
MQHFAQRTITPSVGAALAAALLFILMFNIAFAENPSRRFQKKRFEWTPDLVSAYHKVTSLRFTQAEADIWAIKKQDPQNLMVLHVENYLDVLKIYINENEAEFNRLEKHKEQRIREISNNGDSDSPWFLYLQADIRLQWAVVRLKFEQYPTAFSETNRAFKMLTRNAELFPDFMPNKKNLALLYAVSGTIPDNFRWAIDWFTSLRGTIEMGKKELGKLIEYSRKNEFPYKEEVLVIYAYMLLYLDNKPEDAWEFIQKVDIRPQESPLACLIIANIAMRTYRGDKAIELLSKRPMSKEFYPFHQLEFLLGLTKLHRLDSDAQEYLKRYVNNFKGRNSIKEAYQKIAWSYLLKGDTEGYARNINLCLTKGYAITGNDRNALAEARNKELPSTDLLKSRLLFDGGYFEQAWNVIQGKQLKDFFSKRNQIELLYRKGRILHKLERFKEAHSYYQQAINLGRHDIWYFACRAALEKALIFEKQRDTAKAKQYFQLCLSLNPDDHRMALHQQAKAGLFRISK